MKGSSLDHLDCLFDSDKAVIFGAGGILLYHCREVEPVIFFVDQAMCCCLSWGMCRYGAKANRDGSYDDTFSDGCNCTEARC